jgi:hypothetical protein
MRRTLITLVLLLSGLSPVAVLAQVNSVTGVPTDVLYRFFFFRVMWLQDKADSLKAQGMNDSHLRHLLAQQAGLTTQQESQLIAIASDWRTADVTLRSQIQTLASSGAAALNSPQLKTLHLQQQQLVITHLAQVQAAFGPGAFYLLDLFVHRNINVRGPGVSNNN